MDKRKERLAHFFEAYQNTFNKALQGDNQALGVTAALYSNNFIGASPQGVSCGKNDESLLEAMELGYSFYRQIGIASMEIRSKEIVLLDDFHAMVRVLWRSYLAPRDKGPDHIDFENIYFTQSLDGEPKVFAWITGDEHGVLREHGLI